jgi:hypothetical protein
MLKPARQMASIGMKIITELHLWFFKPVIYFRTVKMPGDMEPELTG